jgi:hypothetical protein
MLDLDDVSPDGYSVQGLRHMQSHVIQSPDCLSSVSDLRVYRIRTRQLQTAVSPHLFKKEHMFI